MIDICANGWEPKTAPLVANVVWSLNLAWIKDRVRKEPGLVALLGPSERAWAARYANAVLSELYIAAHVGLRIILVQKCGAKIAGNDFAITPSGKPFLPGGPEFSFSRSGLQGLVAISEVSCVGVDIERTTTDVVNHWPVRYPILRLFAISSDYDAPGAFLHAWVRLEAWCKRRALALSSILENNEEEFLRKGEEWGTFDPAAELLQLDVPTGYIAWGAIDTHGGILMKQLDL